MKPLDIFHIINIDIKFKDKHYYQPAAQFITYKIIRERSYSIGFMCRNKNKIVRFYPNKTNNIIIGTYCRIGPIPTMFSSNIKYTDIPHIRNISNRNFTLRKLSKNSKPDKLKNTRRKINLLRYSFLFGLSIPKDSLSRFAKFTKSTKRLN